MNSYYGGIIVGKQTKVVEVNGKKAYQWETEKAMLSKETITSKSNIGWEIEVDEKTTSFLDNYGGMTRNFFEFMNEDNVQKVNILIYTTERANIITLIQFLDDKDKQLKWSYAEGKSFAYLTQSKYIPELKKLSKVTEIIPSDVISGELPKYVEPTVDNSSGLVYKGKEVPFSTENNEQIFLINLNEENKLKLSKTGIFKEDLIEKISHFKVILQKELSPFGSLADVEIYLNNNEVLKRKHTDKYFEDFYGENPSDEEIMNFCIEESLEEIQEEMNEIYNKIKEQFESRKEEGKSFDELLNARLKRSKRKFDSIMSEAEEMVLYANEVDSYMIGRQLLQWMFDNDEI